MIAGAVAQYLNYTAQLVHKSGIPTNTVFRMIVQESGLADMDVL